MKQKVILLCAFVAISSIVLGKTPLQFVYFDQVDAHSERLSSISDEQASFFVQYEQANQQQQFQLRS